MTRNLVFGLLLVFILGWYLLPAERGDGSLPHDLLFYLAVLPALVAAAFRLQWPSILSDRVLMPALVFIGVLTAGSFGRSGDLERSSAEVLLHAVATASFLIAAARLIDERRFSILRTAVPVAATAIAIPALVVLGRGQGYVGDRLSSPIHFEHPNLFAHYLGFAAVLAAASALRAPRAVSRWSWTAVTFILTLSVLLTRSRAGFAALLMCLVALFVVSRGRRVAAGLALALVAASHLVPASSGDLNAFVARRDAGRDHIYRTLVERVADRPVFGAGLTADDDVRFEWSHHRNLRRKTMPHPHSIFVGTFYYGGLVGLALLGAVLARSLWAGFRIARSCGWEPLILLGFGITCLLVDGHRLVSEPHLSSWLLIWLPVGLIAGRFRNLEYESAGAGFHEPALDGTDLNLPAGLFAACAALATVQPILTILGEPAPLAGVTSTLVCFGAAALTYGMFVSAVLGVGTGRLALLFWIANPAILRLTEEPRTELVALALAHAAGWLWARHLRTETRTVPGLAVAAAATFVGGWVAPLETAVLLPCLLWLTSASHQVKALATVIAIGAGAAVIASGPGVSGMFTTGGFGLATVMSLGGSLHANVVGVALLIPAAIGLHLGLAPPRRALPVWLAAGTAAVVLAFNPATPSARVLVVVHGPLTAAAALGYLWLIDPREGRESGKLSALFRWLLPLVLVILGAHRAATPPTAPPTGTADTCIFRSGFEIEETRPWSSTEP